MSEPSHDFDRGGGILRRYGILATTFLVFLVGVFFSFQVLFNHKQLIEKESKINIWFLAQTEIEYLRFKESLKDFALRRPGVDLDAVEERFEIFWSRLPVLLHGPQSANLRQVEGLEKTTEKSVATLKEIEPWLQSLDPGDRALIARIGSRLDELGEPLHDMVQRALTFDADLASEERKAHERYYYQLLILFALLLAGGVVLFGAFYRQILRIQRLALQAREAEAQARTAREQLVTAIESVSEGFILYDEHDRVMLFNERYRELHPAQAAALREGASFADLMREAASRGGIAVPGNDVEAWIARCAEMHRHPDGPFETRLSRGTWLRISERRVASGGIVGIHTDITELKLRESELMQTSSLLRATLDNITQGIAVFDRNARLLMWNNCFIDLHGLPPDFVHAGLSYEELVQRYAELGEYGPGPVEHHVEHHLRLLDEMNKGVGRRRFERRRPNGTVIEVAFEPMPGGGFIKTYSDITDRLRAEAQRTQWLEQQVEKRTRQLREEAKERAAAEDALRQAQKMEAVGQLTGGVAHDFNHLLAVIATNIELAAGVSESAAARERLEAGLRAVDRGHQITQRLLAFSRRRPVRTVVTDLRQKLPELMEFLEPSIGRQVSLELSVVPDLWPVEVDDGELQVALLNLVVNARDAMPDGGGVRITARNAVLPVGDRAGERPAALRDLPEEVVEIAVADEGDGIPPTILSRIFEPFFTTKVEGKGSGLGLAQVYGFAKQSKGTITVESELGRGTTFTLYLPRAAAEAAQAAEPVRPTRAPPLLAEAGRIDGKPRILVVDDDEDGAEAAAAALARLGCRVATANRARRALTILAGDPDFDLVFSDIAMPDGMNGIELAAVIEHRHPGLPVLLATGNPQRERLAVAAGPEVLPKPYSLNALFEAVTRNLHDTRTFESGPREAGQPG